MAGSDKSPDAFRTIGELSEELGVAQHILRYWETKFSQLKPLQRAGNRRYYRPTDVELARRINHLLNEEGYTVKGVQKLLKKKADDASAPPTPSPVSSEANSSGGGSPPVANSSGGFAQSPRPEGEATPAPAPVDTAPAEPAPSPFAARLAAVRTGGTGPKVDLDRLTRVRDRLRAALDA